MLLITSRGILPWVALKSQLMRKLRDFTVTCTWIGFALDPLTTNNNFTIPFSLVICVIAQVNVL